MGTIAELSRRKMQGMNPEQRLYQSPTDRGEGRELWRQVFGRPVQPQQTFLTLLSKMIPSHAIATMDAKMAMKEPKESWQGEE